MEATKYKNSGIPWMPTIPDTWTVQRGKNILVLNKRPVRESDEVVTCFRDGEVILRSERRTEGFTMSDKEIGYQGINKGDIVIHGMDGFAGSMGVSKSTGKGSPVLVVCSPKYDAVPQFIIYYLRTLAMTDVFIALSTGIRERSCDLRWNKIAELQFALPSSNIQQRIADFLDRKCAEIDELAALQETMIAELKRYKQSVITEAVTKGLDPNVPMKDSASRAQNGTCTNSAEAQPVLERNFKHSGVEWIGEIPEGWEVKKVKNITTAITKGNGITKEEVFVDGDTPCVRYGEIYSKYDNSFTKCISMTKKDVLPTLHYFGKGDVLCAGTGELVEEIGKSIVYLGESQCLAGGDIIVLSHNQNPLFLNFALNSRYAQSQKSCSKAKLKVVHISAYDIGSVLIAFPPLTEQQQIADYLDRKCAEIDELIAIKQQKIEALKEYKKSVIFEYVTGKKEIEI